MKRFLSFLLFVLLLTIAVGLLQLWKSGGYRSHNLRWALSNLLYPRDNTQRRPEKYTVAEGPRVSANDVDVLAALSRQRIVLAHAVVPSVVSITTSRSSPAPGYNNDPAFQFFHRGMRRNEMAVKALGSGAIVSKEGHIVTNNHVIDQMDQIEVKLSDGRYMQATLIGADPDTDIAILKIDADNIQPLPFGDSELVEVGETVMAVGNPYGLDESVTQGIISAKGRHGSENTSDLFQTDAAINPGNSGGPLVNVRGELIGINEAIFSESGGWQGVGFAIPAATVHSTMDMILRTGRVIHGYLGVFQQGAGADALRQRGLADQRGVLVDGVTAGSPAEKADIQPGDFIQKFNNKSVTNFQELRHGVAEVGVDSTVSIELLRNGKKISVKAVIAEGPPPGAQIPRGSHFYGSPPPFPPILPGTQGNGNVPAPTSDGASLGGVQVVPLEPALAQRLNLPSGVQGVIVQRLEPGTPAAAKLRSGDVIEQINQQPVTSLAEFGRIVRALPENQPTVLSVVRERSRTLVVLNGE